MIRSTTGREGRRPGMRLRSWLAAAGLALLAACGGDDDYGSAPASCDVVSRQTWLRDYFNDWYYWYALSPYPTPGSLPTVERQSTRSLRLSGESAPPRHYLQIPSPSRTKILTSRRSASKICAAARICLALEEPTTSRIMLTRVP